MKRIIIACFVFLSFACVSVSFADAPDKKPSKESLLAAWEQVQKDSPYTVKFEKTPDKGVYTFETTLFPYKGKVQVLNLLVDKHPGEYYEYDDEDAPDHYVGVVEVSLDGLAKDFREKYYQSYETWARDNRLYYDVEASKWFTPIDWAVHKKELRAAKSTSGSCYQSAQASPSQKLFQVLLSWGPMIFFLVVWIWICVFSARKLRKKQEAIQAKFLQLSEDSLAVNREILEALKRKS